MAKLLTAHSVEKLKPGTERIEIPDARLTGLYLIIQPSGAKSWALRYRYAGKPRKLTLGSYPTIDLAKARKRAGDGLEALEGGRDPADAERQAKARAALVGDRDAFGNVARAFIEKHARPRNKSWKETARLLGLKPDPDNPELLLNIKEGLAERWAGRDIGKISRRDMIDMLDEIDGKTAANRTLAAVRKLFNWALARDIINTSPCTGIDAHPENSRDRVLTDAEIRALWTAAEAEGYPFGPIVQLLLLTAQRRSEVAGMREAELDLVNKTWSLPKERTKNKKPHDVPLSGAAVDIITRLHNIAGDAGYLFTGTGRSPFSGYSRSKRALDKAMLKALQADDPEATLPRWTLHDLRRTASTRMHDAGVLPHIVEAVINHISGHKAGVAGTYNAAEYERQKRKSLERFARHLNRIITGKTATIVPFPVAGS